MAVINFLPQFKVVEPNRLTGLVMGHVVSQFPLNPAFAGIIHDYGYDMVENGFILGLGSELEVDEFDPSRHAQPFLLFTEELNTFFSGLKWYATGADEQDGKIYPRLVGLYPGDSFTTNNYDGTYTDQKFAKVIDGKLSLQGIINADTMFAVEESTLPTGDLALRFTYIRSLGDDEPSAPQTPMTITSNIPDPITADEETAITIGTVANSFSGTMVRAFFTLPESFTLTYQEGGTGPDIPLVDVFGPSTGFPLGNITTPFKLTASEAGTFNITVAFRRVSDNVTLATQTFAVNVEAAPELSSQAEILTFAFTGVEEEALQIDTENAEVNITVPSGTTIDEIDAVFTISTGASSEPTSPILDGDFTESVLINVVAEDETEKAWTVNVTVAGT